MLNETRKLIRTDGSEVEIERGKTTRELAALIGADTLDTMSLRDRWGHVLLVDDAGYEKGLPVNPKATALYLARCIAGTTYKIRGDVVIVPDGDFA